MQRYTRAEVLKLFYKNQSSVVATQRVFWAKFHGQTALNGRTLRRLSATFLETGVVTDVQRSGKKRTSRSDENIERVRQDVSENAETSIRKRAALGIEWSQFASNFTSGVENVNEINDIQRDLERILTFLWFFFLLKKQVYLIMPHPVYIFTYIK